MKLGDLKLPKGGFRVVPKGWGHELWIVNKSEYCGKLLHFEEGKRCSFHHHGVKDETFWVLSGTLEIAYSWDDDRGAAETAILNAGDGFYVPVGLRHQMTAIGGPAEMIEFSTEHFDSDSKRIIPGD